MWKQGVCMFPWHPVETWFRWDLDCEALFSWELSCVTRAKLWVPAWQPKPLDSPCVPDTVLNALCIWRVLATAPMGQLLPALQTRKLSCRKTESYLLMGAGASTLRIFFLNFLVKGSCQAIHQWVNFFISTFIIRWLMTGCHWCVDCRHYLEIPMNVQMKIRIWETMEHGWLSISKVRLAVFIVLKTCYHFCRVLGRLGGGANLVMLK